MADVNPHYCNSDSMTCSASAKVCVRTSRVLGWKSQKADVSVIAISPCPISMNRSMVRQNMDVRDVHLSLGVYRCRK